jgi:hypothetical protein
LDFWRVNCSKHLNKIYYVVKKNFFFIDFRILKFYEIFERVVSLLRHALGCLPGNNRVVTR